MYPIVKKAKQSPNYGKAYIKGDNLIVNNTTYNFDSLHKLPEDIHPKQFSYKENNECLIFGGPHSVYNFLSNYFPHKVIYCDIVHDTVEHAYQYAKATHFDDTATAHRILCARSTAVAKQLDTKVAHFDRTIWVRVKDGVMETLLRIKFADGSEMAHSLKSTTGKHLAEAGRSTTFAIGMSLNHKHILDRSKWPANCNLLGKCLMSIRDDLN